MVISVSRRCDIPRFRFDWFMERLEAGFVDVANPFNAAQVRRVLLRPAVEDCVTDAGVLVFWTRDPRPILDNIEALEKRCPFFYVMVTVTGYPAILEPKIPPAEIICAAMGELARKIGSRRVIWRYDPIFISGVTDGDFHRRNFSLLARNLTGPVRRVIVSLYDEYRGAKRRIEALEKAGFPRRETPALPAAGLGRLLADLVQTAGAAGMEIQSCAEAENFEAFGINAGACIDGELMRELWGVETKGKDKHQRPHCLCAQSVDIGRYGDCPAGCVYCYAFK
jgi:DNA repair photolyase